MTSASKFFRCPADVTAAIAVVAGVVALSLVSRGIYTAPHAHAAATDGARGRELLHQSAEWMRISESTQVPLFAYRHAIFAVAYLQASRSVASDDELQRAGVDVHRLSNRAEARILNLSRRLGKACPASNPSGAKPTSVTWL
jgi:hypothetical protein